MNTNTANTKTLRFSDEVDGKLGRLAKKIGRSKQQFFEEMVEYFYRTKKDPADINDEVLKNTIVKGHQNLTGFIRVQEQTLLIPMKQDIDRMIGSQKKILECFNTQILEHNRQMMASLQNKEQLKSRFLFLLDSYAKSISQATPLQKEELLKKVKEQINQL